MTELLRANLVAAGLGRKGSGKSKLMFDLFTSKAPRLLTLDPNGESPEQNPNAVQTFGWGQLMDALTKAAEYDRWHIAAAALEDDELAQLAELLTPKSPDRPSLARMFGGLALECTEVQELFPNPAPRQRRALLTRGRHYLLSQFYATQRPALCDRIVTSQADILFAFGQTDPRDLDYIERELGSAIAEEVRKLPQYHFVYFTRADGRAYLCDDQRRPYRVFNTFGEDECTSPLSRPTTTTPVSQPERSSTANGSESPAESSTAKGHVSSQPSSSDGSQPAVGPSQIISGDGPTSPCSTPKPRRTRGARPL